MRRGLQPPQLEEGSGSPRAEGAQRMNTLVSDLQPAEPGENACLFEVTLFVAAPGKQQGFGQGKRLNGLCWGWGWKLLQIRKQSPPQHQQLVCQK